MRDTFEISAKCFSYTACCDFCCCLFLPPPIFIASVIAVLEKNDFFVGSVTKRIFFLTLHDAVLAAVEKHQKPDGLQLSSKEVADKLQAKHQKVGYFANI